MAIKISDLPPKYQQAAMKQILEQQRGKMRSRAAPQEPGKETKYHNQPAERTLGNGKAHVFPSIREAERYDVLIRLLDAGEIRSLKLQPQFTLQESYITADGERVRAIRYVADFSYEKICNFPMRTLDGVEVGGTGWEFIVEDAKGHRTEKYKIKKKLMREKFGINIQEV